MKVAVRYSEKQKKLFRTETFKMLKEGVKQIEIARKLGVSRQYICTLKRQLIKEKIITQEEIEQKKQELMEKKQKENKKNEPKRKTRKDIERERQERKKKVLELLKDGKTEVEIMKILKIPKSTIYDYTKSFIDNGLIEKKEIVRQCDKISAESVKKVDKIKELLQEEKKSIKEIAKEVDVSVSTVYYVKSGKYEIVKKRNKGRVKKTKETYSSNPEARKNLRGIELDVYNELIKGYNYAYIEKKLGITHEKCMNIVNILNVVGALSRKEIKEIREKQKEKVKKEALKLLRQGYTQAEIMRKIDHITDWRIMSKIVSELKGDGLITQEEMEAAQNENYREYWELVLIGMKKGLMVKEIIALDKTGYLSVAIVNRMQKILVEKGAIDLKEFNRKNEKRRKKQRKEMKKESDNEYIELLKKGLTFKEIATVMGFKERSVREKWYSLRDEYKITKEDLEEWRKERINKIEEAQKALNKYIYGGRGVKKVKELFEFWIEEKSLGREFSKEEIEKFGRALLMDEELLNYKNLKFVIMEYIKKFTYNESKQYLNKLLRFYNDTIYADAIKNFIKEFYEVMDRELEEEEKFTKENIEIRDNS